MNTQHYIIWDREEVYLVQTSPMYSKKAQEASRSSIVIRELQKGRRFVLIAIILRSFFRRIRQVCARAAIAVTAVDRYIPERERARGKAFVRALHSEHGALHDSICRFANIAKRRELREKVLGVSADTCMLMRGDNRDIPFIVDTGKETGEAGDNGTPDAGVSKGDV